MMTAIINEALTALHQGHLIVYPTDTQYALGADIYQPRAIQQVFSLKQRPKTLPLPVAVSDVSAVQRIADLTPSSLRLIEHFLPGPLTIILPKKPEIPSEITGVHDSIAVRIPDHPIALELLATYGPLTVTSANIHSKKPFTLLSDIQMQFRKHIDVFIDGGALDGEPSTIIDCTTTPLTLLREGPILFKDIKDVISF